MDFEPAEQEYMAALGPIISRSPRTVKRFVNTYRIIRMQLGGDDLATFLGETPDQAAGFTTVLYLLAMVVGAPQLAAPVFEAIAQLPDDSNTDTDSMADRLKALEPPTGVDIEPELSKALSRVLHPNQDESLHALPSPALGRVRYWSGVVRRFSFHRLAAA